MISPDWTLILQFINFFVLLFILNKFLYRPLLDVMAQRRERIEGGKNRARELEREIEQKMERYQDQLNSAKGKAAQERMALRKAAQQEEARITGEAQKNAAVRVKGIREQVEKEATEAEAVLKKEASNLAGLIAEKVLGRNLA